MLFFLLLFRDSKHFNDLRGCMLSDYKLVKKKLRLEKAGVFYLLIVVKPKGLEWCIFPDKVIERVVRVSAWRKTVETSP